MGATGFGYGLAEQFGLAVTAREAALVPFTLKGRWLGLAQQLAGVSLPVHVTCGGQSFVEAMLFTHRGLSGPAMLQISNYWAPGAPIEIDLLPGDSVRDLVEQWSHNGAKASLKTLLARRITTRLITDLVASHPQPHSS